MTVRILLFLKRRADLTQEQFDGYWSNIHAPIVTSAKESIRFLKYNQFHVVPAHTDTLEKKGGVSIAPYDGVAEFEVNSIEDFLIVAKSEDYMQKIWPDCENFLDTSSMTYLAGEDQVKLLNQAGK
ncbi:hypothetical protein M422DRAFT_240353 [Sphaerobolus stellatus SS14]|nr:hypothetical protein M422DRAFT_240353 [Sphaerobolus stellatus SS14]